MYNTIKDHHLTGTHGVPQRPFQGVPTGKPHHRDKADEGIVKNDRLLPDLNVWPITLNDLSGKFSGKGLRQLAGLMVEVTRKFTGSIDTWSVGLQTNLRGLSSIKLVHVLNFKTVFPILPFPQKYTFAISPNP